MSDATPVRGDQPQPDARVQVEVIHALPGEQCLLSVSLEPGATVADAVEQSGVLTRYPQLLEEALHWRFRVGIYGQQCDPERVLCDGDRVEIYRPLLIDPKQARRQRAKAKVMTDSD